MIRIGANVRFAAVGNHSVTVAVAVQASWGATVGNAGRFTVKVGAGDVAAPAVLGIGCVLGFAAIQRIAVTIAPAGGACHLAKPALTRGRAVGGTAGAGAGATVQHVTKYVRFAAILVDVVAVAVTHTTIRSHANA
jgi:hypothetical protein